MPMESPPQPKPPPPTVPLPPPVPFPTRALRAQGGSLPTPPSLGVAPLPPLNIHPCSRAPEPASPWV